MKENQALPAIIKRRKVRKPFESPRAVYVFDKKWVSVVDMSGDASKSVLGEQVTKFCHLCTSHTPPPPPLPLPHHQSQVGMAASLDTFGGRTGSGCSNSQMMENPIYHKHEFVINFPSWNSIK